MSQNATGIEFLGDLREKWVTGQMTSDDVLSEVLRWEDNMAVRTDDELDAAWEFRQEVEGSSGLKGGFELESMLSGNAARHIDTVVAELYKVASAGRLNDSYAGSIQKVLREGGQRHAEQIQQMLEPGKPLTPALQGLLDSLGPSIPAAVPPVNKDPNLPGENGVAHVLGSGSGGGNGSHNGPEDGLDDGAEAATLQKTVPLTAVPSFTSTHGGEDPWVAAQNLMARGRWDDARSVVAQFPSDHPRFQEVPRLLNAITEGEVYDQVPGLGAMPGKLASSRSRRNWGEFNKRREEAEQLLADAAAKLNKTIQMPRSLNDIFEDALKAQDAEALVERAIKQRMDGDFSGAATSLLDASTLDPRYARVQDEQQRNTDLKDMLVALRRNPLNTASELAEGLMLCEQLLEPNAAPASEEVSNRNSAILAKVEKLVENTYRRIEGRKKVVGEPGNLEDKLSTCDAVDKQLEDIWLLRRDDPDLHEVQEWADKTRRRLGELKAERNELGKFVTDLDVSARIDPILVESVSQRMENLSNEPLVQGDGEIRAITQAYMGKLSTYLDTMLHPGKLLDLATLENHAEVLRLAQHGPRGLSPQQVNTYSRAIWTIGSTLVRSHLPKGLPPYTPPQAGQATTPRSEAVISGWDQALRALNWLRDLPDALAEQQTIEALEREFALSVSQILETTSTFPPKITKEESEERVVTARTIKQYMQTLPESIRAKISPQVLTSKRTQTEAVVRRRRILGVMIPVTAFVVLALLLTGGATWALTPGNIGNPYTPTPTATLTPAPTSTTVPTPIVQDIRQFVVPEVNRNSPDCVFVNGFNVCDSGNRQFKTWYLENKDFLGTPISREFEDFQVSAWVQYFGMGRLEWANDASGSRPTFGLIGDDLLRAMAPNKPNLKAAQAQVSKPQSGCEAVPGYPHWLCTSFLDFYKGTMNGKNPVDFYGYPLTEEYVDKVKGDDIPRQFFQRALFQGIDGKVERLPVGLLYLNWARKDHLRGEYLPMPAGVNIDPADVHPTP